MNVQLNDKPLEILPTSEDSTLNTEDEYYGPIPTLEEAQTRLNARLERRMNERISLKSLQVADELDFAADARSK